MLCVLAITALATIWTGTVKAEPKEEAILNCLTDLLKTNEIPADLLGNDDKIKIPFRKAAKSNGNVVDLLMADKSKGSTFKVTIRIKEKPQAHIATKPTISLEVYKDNKSQEQMRLIVHFQTMIMEQVKLYVPVFEVPPMYVDHRERLRRWAQAKGVCSLSPFNHKELNSLASDETVDLDFDWLKVLLSYGLHRHQYQTSSSKEFSAWTRPLVLDPKVIREFINLWKNFKGTGNSSSS